MFGLFSVSLFAVIAMILPFFWFIAAGCGLFAIIAMIIPPWNKCKACNQERFPKKKKAA